jgi:glycerophosphoryl diester phosphodiesterase
MMNRVSQLLLFSSFAGRFLLIVLFFSCSLSKKINEMQQPEFDKQGHRGARGLMPENTWPAMKAALDLGVTTLEMDVVVTKDQQVVLSHEPFFSHDITTKPDGSLITVSEERSYNIFQMNYDEVRRFDVGLKPLSRFPKQQKISAYKPLLSEVIDSINSYMKSRNRPYPYLNIETKCTPPGDGLFHPVPSQFVDLIMNVIVSKNLMDKVIVQSFDYRTLRYLHEKHPQIKTAMLVEKPVLSFEKQLEDLGFIPTIYSPHYLLVNSYLINQCRKKGIKIIPWTVNEKKKIEELQEAGVDGIITDYPDLFKY